jgi:hypothetical protein
MRALQTAVAIMVGSLFVAGCSQTTSPTVPSSGPSALPSPPPAPSPSAASSVLAVSSFTVTVIPPAKPGDAFSYAEKFVLTETTRRSGATVQKIESSTDKGDDTEVTDAGCWRNTIRVEPGGSLDVFEVGRDSIGDLSYCAPFAASRTEASRVSIIVTFTDDDGRSGIVQGTATVTR